MKVEHGETMGISILRIAETPAIMERHRMGRVTLNRLGCRNCGPATRGAGDRLQELSTTIDAHCLPTVSLVLLINLMLNAGAGKVSTSAKNIYLMTQNSTLKSRDRLGLANNLSEFLLVAEVRIVLTVVFSRTRNHPE